LSAGLCPRPLAVLWGIFTKKRGEERGERRGGEGERRRGLGMSSSFALGRKKRKVGGCVSKHIISTDGGVREIDTGLGQEFYAYTDPYTCNRYGQNVTTLC